MSTKHVWATVPPMGRNWNDINDRLTEMGQAVGADNCGAGTGFGARDMDWTCEEDEAARLVDPIRGAYPDAEIVVEDE